MNRELYGVLIGALTLVALVLPLPLFVLTVALLSLLMGRELSRALGIGELSGASFFAPLSFAVHPALGGVYTGLLSLTYGYRTWNLDAFMRALFVLFYTGLFPSYLIKLREEGFYLLLVFILSVWANDVFAYYVGKSFGRRLLLPKLSPNKTLEGFLGGLIAGTLVFALLSGLPLLRAVLIGVLFISTGVAGDYLKSFVKRQLGIKDFSNVLGGHGGFVDRFDAVVFSAPVFYWLTYRI
ncbi:phosphatidate cytidylyltransferase [Hydrogenivirga sp.]